MEVNVLESDSELAKALVWPWGSAGAEFELLGAGSYFHFTYAKPHLRVITVHLDNAVLASHQNDLIREAQEVVGHEGTTAISSWLLTLLYEALDIYESPDLNLWFDGEDFVPKP
jgi:hypothetical protein